MIVASAEVNPVQELYKELGLGMGNQKQKGSWLARVIRAAHAWTETDTTVLVVLLASGIALFYPVTTFIFLVIATSSTLAIATGIIFSKKKPKKANRIFFYTFLVELGVVAGVGAYLGYPVVSAVPLTVTFLFWFGNGIYLVGPEEKSRKKTAEELVGEAFEKFIAKNRPDVVDKDSALNQSLDRLAQNISRAEDVLAKLRGEIKTVSAESDRADALQHSINKIADKVAELSFQKAHLETERRELLSALQVFEALKNNAVSYVRLWDLSQEADEVLGEASALSYQAQVELDRIREDIRGGLIRLGRAVEKLGLNTLPGLEDGASVDALYSGAERIGEQTIEHERKLRLLGS